MKKISIIIALFTMCIATAFGQAKKPKLMVVPSDAWCKQHNFTKTFDNQGTEEVIPDYQKALSTDKDLNNVISKINILMADRGFPLQDMQQSLKSINNISAEDRLLTSRTSGATIAESPLDRLRRTAKADILLEVDWTISEVGPKKTVTYNLKGLDAYSNKQVAGAQGTGAPSFSAEVPVLLEEAVQDNMDNFTAQLQAHFDDMMANGREVVIDVRVFDNGSGLTLEEEFNGTELSEIIDDWMAENTVSHRFSKADATENYINYDQVRIPLYKANGMPQDTNDFTRTLAKFLRNAPYNIPCKVINRGLGRCLIILGEK
ncbi:DUF6175 family protein [uncultured Prevotella sp.]|uniref:DUF6175 family protein n=1 Tax=uncultured Prevotella sp. TaxID=159272 RepID=UPI00262EDF9E|nr:DUF6175 family protein [uncultured Prevotella sp.]